MQLLSLATLALAFGSSLASAALSPRGAYSPRFKFGQGGTMVRGVNAGGWLVLEPFVTPGVFTAAGDNRIKDEWTYGQLGYGGNRTAAAAALRKHQETFYTEADFAKMAEYGLNTVRIPIGYWAFGVTDKEPYLVLDQWKLLKQACVWAGKYGLKVMVDLHGVKGSQNGYNHSGRQGQAKFQYNQTLLDDGARIVNLMANEFKQAKYGNSVGSIAVLNEPNQAFDVIEGWYRRVYSLVRNQSNGLAVVLNDGFLAPDYWQGRFPSNRYPGLVLDSHIYTIFVEDQIKLDMNARLKEICSRKADWAARNRDSIPQIMGEFSPAFTDCAVWLNGRGAGARYDGTLGNPNSYKGDCGPKRVPAKQFTADYKRLLARYWQIQREVGEAASGWIAWTWKTSDSSAEEWSYQRGVTNGFIPKDLNRALVPDTCSWYQ